MKSIKLLTLSILFLTNLNAQTDVDILINSKILNAERKIKIHLPKSFKTSKEKSYPLILVLDAENTFYLTTGNTELMSDPDPDFSTIPEAIVVGIYQDYFINGEYVRGTDSMWDTSTGKLSKSSAKFYEFLKDELIPYLEKKYRIGKFKTLLGHSLTASFACSAILENDDVFSAYILLSPNLKDFNYKLFDGLEKKSTKKLVYLSTSDNDFKGHRESILKFNENYLSKNSHTNTVYRFQNFEKEHHMSLVSSSLLTAVTHIFTYHNFTKKNSLVKEFLLSKNKMESYLSFKNTANELSGEENNIRDDDFFDIYWNIDKEKDWSQYLEVSNILFEEFPNSTHPYYARAMFEEKHMKNYLKALEFYNKGLKYINDSFFDEDSYRKDIERTKKLMEK
jgi:predicted alpha/beta superfamily hydrolase